MMLIQTKKSCLMEGEEMKRGDGYSEGEGVEVEVVGEFFILVRLDHMLQAEDA